MSSRPDRRRSPRPVAPDEGPQQGPRDEEHGDDPATPGGDPRGACPIARRAPDAGLEDLSAVERETGDEVEGREEEVGVAGGAEQVPRDAAVDGTGAGPGREPESKVGRGSGRGDQRGRTGTEPAAVEARVAAPDVGDDGRHPQPGPSGAHRVRDLVQEDRDEEDDRIAGRDAVGEARLVALADEIRPGRDHDESREEDPARADPDRGSPDGSDAQACRGLRRHGREPMRPVPCRRRAA